MRNALPDGGRNLAAACTPDVLGATLSAILFKTTSNLSANLSNASLSSEELLDSDSE